MNELAALPVRFRAPLAPPFRLRALAPVELMVPAPAKVRAVALVAIVSSEATPVRAPAVETFRPPELVRAKVPVALPMATEPVLVEVAMLVLPAPELLRLSGAPRIVTVPVVLPILLPAVPVALMLVVPVTVKPPVPWIRPEPELTPTKVAAPALVTCQVDEVPRISTPVPELAMASTAPEALA